MDSRVAGSAGAGSRPIENRYSASSDAARRSASVMLDPSILNDCPDSPMESLGSRRQIGAGVALMGRHVTIELQACREALGETDQRVVEQVERYIDHGVLPENPPDGSMFVQIAELHAADTGKTRESRMHSVLEAGMEVLGAAKGPGLNLLNIVGRTGLIVALTTVLRQVVSYHVEQALREGDTPEATRAWLVAAQVMTGPALILAGAIRNECGGMAKLSSRLGRICMASITMGAFLMAHLTGASKDLLPSITGVTIYTLARGLANAFFTLSDNAGPPNIRATGVAAAAYGAVQFILAEVALLLPLSGAARSAAELGYSLGADIINGGLNAVGMVINDVITLLCKISQELSPSRGLDSIFFSDPESLPQKDLEVSADIQIPNWPRLAGELFDLGPQRLSAGHLSILVAWLVSTFLNDSEVGEDYKDHIKSGSYAAMAMATLVLLVFGSDKRTDNTYTLEETVGP